MSFVCYAKITAKLGSVNNELRLLAVHAHPDDEASKGAATIAKYVAEGIKVLIVTATGGERGDLLNKSLEISPNADIAQIRKQEMANAIKILGCQHRWLGFVDSGYPEGHPKPPLPDGCFAALDPEKAAAPLVEIFREFKPHVVTTYDENGGYPHPDHIRTHEITMRAYQNAADSSYPSDLSVWQVPKIYYHQTFSYDRVVTMHQAALTANLISPFAEWLTDWEPEPSRVTTQVHCAEYFSVRDNVLKAHATQVDPTGMWFAFPRELEREIWPTEDYELAIDNVGVKLPETDLFNGLRG